MDHKEHRTFCIAMSHVAADQYIGLGDYLSSCRRLSVDGCDRNVVAGDTPCTWKVDGSIFLTLVKNCVGLPLVYFHCNDCIYHQNPVSGIGLSPSFPSKSAVLAQYYLDDDERSGDCLAQNYKKELRVLDIVSLHGECMAGMHPYQRYKILSDGWQDGWFMPRECVQLQWVGNYSAITPVFSGEMKLPHTPLHPLCLTSEDPLVMLNPL